ncbi:hypothetical protein N8612_06085 [Verrucomicrobia bacterium]|nr:hypothetical protein [Verrucomicrobiota bacterium]
MLQAHEILILLLAIPIVIFIQKAKYPDIPSPWAWVLPGVIFYVAICCCLSVFRQSPAQ